MQRLVLVLTLFAPAIPWSAFRGDGNSVTGHPLPIKWDGAESLRWSADLGGYGQSSPIIWGNRVLVTSMVGAERKNHGLVECFALDTGKQLWERRFECAQTLKVSDYSSRGAPTPAADGERFYVFFESGNLAALSHQGEVLWERALTADYGEFKGNHGLGSSLALSEQAVLALVDHDGPSYLLALEKDTGKTKWKAERPQNVSWTSPIVVGSGAEQQVFVNAGGRLDVYQASTGAPLYHVTGLEGNNVPSATVSADYVVVGAQGTSSNLAIRRGGNGDVTDSHIAWRADGVTSSFASPLIYRGMVYFVSRAGVATCLDLKTGEQLWQHRLGDSCWASPLASGDHVYFFTKGGTTVVLAAERERKVVAENRLPCKDRVYGVATAPSTLVIREGTRIYALSK